MPYKIVTRDVDLTLKEQEMAEAIIAAYSRWSELTGLEQEAWRIFKDVFYDGLRVRLGAKSHLRSLSLDGDKMTIGYEAAPYTPGAILPGCKQVRWYVVEHVDETKEPEAKAG